jgi:hypothetical protein
MNRKYIPHSDNLILILIELTRVLDLRRILFAISIGDANVVFVGLRIPLHADNIPTLAF